MWGEAANKMKNRFTRRKGQEIANVDADGGRFGSKTVLERTLKNKPNISTSFPCTGGGGGTERESGEGDGVQWVYIYEMKMRGDIGYYVSGKELGVR